MNAPTDETRREPRVGIDDQDVPLATFQELAAQYHHRLLSLEAELKDQARARALSPRAFAKRVDRLKEVHGRLSALQRLCAAETPGAHSDTDIGLPTVEECTPAELQVCEAYLEQRLDEVEDAASETGRVYKWLVDAVSGRTGSFRLTFRLSKLRRLIQATERETEAMQEAHQSLTLHTDKVLSTAGKGGIRGLRGGASSGASKTALEGLMTLFQQLDTTIARVARLKASVKKERDKTLAMEAWLRQEEGTIRARPTQMPPPSPLAMAQAAAAAEGPKPTYHRRVARRRRVAEEFWQDVVHNGMRTPTEREIQRAATLLRDHTPSRDKEPA